MSLNKTDEKMNAHEIACFLKNHRITRRYFRGVFSRDQLSNMKLRSKSVYIVNTDKAAGPGEHWIVIAAVSADKRATPSYYCPLGIPPIYKQIIRFLLSQQPRFYRYNAVAVQHIDSTSCGQFCIDAAIQFCRGLSICEIRQRYNLENLQINDTIVRILLRKEIKPLRERYN